MPQETFRHDELPSDHIRLVRLHKAELGSTVCIDIFAVKHDAAPHYEALSYRWDEESPKIVIHANGTPMKIMVPVHEFLVWLQTEQHEPLLWIDSLCIDQDPATEASEKEVQILLMGHIFSQADRVLVWLGELDLVDKVIALVAALADGSHVPFQLTSENLVDRGDQSAWEALCHLLSHAWFTRIWVAQEVILAKDVCLIVGNTTIAWDQFCKSLPPVTAEVGQRLYAQRTLAVAALQGLAMAYQLQELRLSGKTRWDMGELLELSVTMKATRPHDQIYGVLGLCDVQQYPWLLQPRYDLPVSEVFRMATVSALKTSTRPLLLLAISGCGISTETTMASWIINPANRRGMNHHIGRNSDYAAGLHIESSVTVSDDLTSSLGLGGNVIDRITRLGPPSVKLSRLDSTEADRLKDLQAMVKEVDRLANAGLQSKNNEAAVEIIWKSLVGYHAIDDFPNAGEMRKCYAAFRWLLRHEIQAKSDNPSTILYLGADDSRGQFATNLQLAVTFIDAYCEVNIDHRVALTKSGRLAMVPPLTEVGDYVCILWGANMPYLLRPVENTALADKNYRLVGYTYILDYMWGDYADKASGQMFTIV